MTLKFKSVVLWHKEEKYIGEENMLNTQVGYRIQLVARRLISQRP